MEIIFFLIFSYLCGSLSSAVIVCRLLGLPDPRQAGSHNPGATNVLRIGGKKAAAAVLFLDAFKGFLTVVLAKILISHPLGLGFIALAAILGHMYPVFFKFQGGKGVATLIGVLFGISWLAGAVFVGIWLVVAALFRYSSLAALVASVCSPFFTAWIAGSGYFLPILLGISLLVYRHRGNIQRLLKGTEPKI